MAADADFFLISVRFGCSLIYLNVFERHDAAVSRKMRRLL
jgi:hypothetical protein